MTNLRCKRIPEEWWRWIFWACAVEWWKYRLSRSESCLAWEKPVGKVFEAKNSCLRLFFPRFQSKNGVIHCFFNKNVNSTFSFGLMSTEMSLSTNSLSYFRKRLLIWNLRFQSTNSNMQLFICLNTPMLRPFWIQFCSNQRFLFWFQLGVFDDSLDRNHLKLMV